MTFNNDPTKAGQIAGSPHGTFLGRYRVFPVHTFGPRLMWKIIDYAVFDDLGRATTTGEYWTESEALNHIAELRNMVKPVPDTSR